MDLNTIIALERKLLDPVVRKSVEELDRLLHDDFLEFGTSGMTYDKNVILKRLPEEEPQPIEAYDFQAIQLAADVVQLRFKTRRKMGNGSTSVSLRSSIWKCTNDRWQMLFHQGTRVPH